MPNYKLIYFNVKGRAEPSRYMFALAGVEYEDKRVEAEDWKELKPTLTLGRLPVLEVDGKQLFQSHAIHRFVAAKLDYCGSTAWDRAQVDVILETLQEVTPHLDGIFSETDETKKAELKEKFETEHLPKNLASLEKLLKLNKGGDGWFVGDKVSLADIASFSYYCDFFPYMILGEQVDLSKYEKFAALAKRFKELPKVAEWIKKRPETDH